MIEKYKPGITLFSVLSFFAILFPPVVWKRTSGFVLDKGFSFLLSISNYRESIHGDSLRVAGSVNFGQLFLELFIILIISVLFQLYFDKIKASAKDNL